MLRLLSYNHIFAYAFLFVLTFLIRIPSLQENYYEQDESFYLVAAERIVDGGVQYADTWDNKPPVIVWVYTFFLWIFGSGAIIAIRIFTCIYIFVSALLLNKLISDHKLLKHFSLLPAMLYIIFCSVPWYTQELNGEILMNLPIILAASLIILMKERSAKNKKYLFIAGLLMGLAFMIKYQGIFLFLGMMLAFLSMQPPRLSETFSLLSGFFLSALGIVMIVYGSGAFADFWDIGVAYNLDYIFLGANPGEVVNFWSNVGQYLKLWGFILLLGMIGLGHFRLTFFTNTIVLRRTESVILFWFGAAMITIVIGAGRLYLHYFYLLVPPLVVYVSKFFELKIRGWSRSTTLFFLLAVPVITYFVFLVSAFPNTFAFAYKYTRKDGWVRGMRDRLNNPHVLSSYIDPKKVRNGILVLNYEPDIYTRLDLPCATKYTNFSLAYYKFDFFAHNKGKSRVSSMESAAEVYRAFENERPEYIIDTGDLELFPQMKAKIPMLFSDYKMKAVDEKGQKYKVYYLD